MALPIDAWLPVGAALANGARTRLPLSEGPGWQIVRTDPEGRALLVQPALLEKWLAAHLVQRTDFQGLSSATGELFAASFAQPATLAPLAQCRRPTGPQEALAFARALRRTRQSAPQAALADALYVQGLGVLLPTHTGARPADAVTDAQLLGQWLTGAPLPASDFSRLRTLVEWMTDAVFTQILEAAGIKPLAAPAAAGAHGQRPPAAGPFRLHGRPALERFFREHVLDVLEHAERYRAFGITFPGAIVLHGPPGCGKTFAVEQLVKHLGWAGLSLNAASIASPYIHETPRKIAALFEEATRCAPAVLIIDEMEAFLTDRERGPDAGQHRTEEIAELLQRIPRASSQRVLTIGMTNRLHLIDSALLRRGRFDHIIEVGMPEACEVEALLTHLLGSLPCAGDLQLAALGRRLAGRPLSDSAFLVREAARLAAAAGQTAVRAALLDQALQEVLSRGEAPRRHPIGFT